MDCHEAKRNGLSWSKKKWTVMNPIRRRMKKRNPSSGQNGQLVHWWLLIHSGPKWAAHKLFQYILTNPGGPTSSNGYATQSSCTGTWLWLLNLAQQSQFHFVKAHIGEFVHCDVMGSNLPVRPSSLAAGTQAASQPKRTGPRVCGDFVSQPWWSVCGDHTDACCNETLFQASLLTNFKTKSPDQLLTYLQRIEPHSPRHQY
jgi:hypothetical protein